MRGRNLVLRLSVLDPYTASPKISVARLGESWLYQCHFWIVGDGLTDIDSVEYYSGPASASANFSSKQVLHRSIENPNCRGGIWTTAEISVRAFVRFIHLSQSPLMLFAQSDIGREVRANPHIVEGARFPEIMQGPQQPVLQSKDKGRISQIVGTLIAVVKSLAMVNPESSADYRKMRNAAEEIQDELRQRKPNYADLAQALERLDVLASRHPNEVLTFAVQALRDAFASQTPPASSSED